MTDQQDWDAAAAEAGYLPTSEYVKRWAMAREAAREALQTAQSLHPSLRQPKEEQ
jgi:hypothetical protein